MNDGLRALADALALDSPRRESLRLRFGLACALRVAHLLENPELAAALEGLKAYLAGDISRPALNVLALRSAELARSHPGSPSLDGCGHAAVSASHAVAMALSGRALQAAEYAAYAAVYGQGGYGAASEPEAFAPEFDWQIRLLRELAKSE
ncbi:putative immunity protein [Chromobacterium sp. IIBBL 290-4]|uniref:putative immunity protein n=1 Tax=Chromobacterium sp. IIBBL 290-4 TaxID=2953890 RepID=UPI0020B820F2|nr:hypothetical protein [Chromobacterium sp. IIBBL 290-4]UTH72894.1 hypothetical protein NKT35_15275 [Chromobacterium sp. IIBBL 290-4]